ncbi:hypothetical protein MSG28_007800 [Choristoneura fumiferana]|uniref:Uncharacterized protein n=1 Tax=Choristoneura fumiferana TaxID=7141 RepID=A0ACC0JYV6_CHOFU|nr:hypothetical protein MSG28_007800 [Choristoneura fumiferana]
MGRRLCSVMPPFDQTEGSANSQQQSFYSSSLWIRHTKRAYNAIKVQYNNTFRLLLGLPSRCSASGMFCEARTDGCSGDHAQENSLAAGPYKTDLQLHLERACCKVLLSNTWTLGWTD